MRLHKTRFFHTVVLVAGLWATVNAAAQSPAPAKETRKSSSKKVAPSNPVDLNTATQAELESVPGIGTSTAKKIIAGRPYSSTAELAKAGIAAKSIQEISPMVKVSAVPARMAAPVSRPPVADSSQIPARKPPAVSVNPPSGPAQQPPAPGMVWANEETKVFHRSTDRWYGRTKKGKFLTEQDALKAGYRESKEK